jgi:hypothetical protein
MLDMLDEAIYQGKSYERDDRMKFDSPLGLAYKLNRAAVMDLGVSMGCYACKDSQAHLLVWSDWPQRCWSELRDWRG